MSEAAVERYTGEGEPPSIVMTLNAATETVFIDANFTVTLNGVQSPNTITITRSPDAANFQTEPSTDVDDRFSRSYAGTGKLYMVLENCTIKLCIYKLWLHTECKAEKDSDGLFNLSYPPFVRT